MRILQISSAKSFGGGERHLVDLTNALIKKGHDLYVALTPGSPLIPHLAKIESGKILPLPLRNALDISSGWKLRKFVRDQRIEIIHAHVARDYPLAALAVGRPGNAKLVLTRHVMFPLSKVHKLTKRRVTRVIAISEAVADNLRAQNIFDPHQIAVIRHGIDLTRFHLTKNPESKTSDTLRVGMLGELSPVKGQDDFLRAAAIVAAHTDNVEFVIVGRDNSSDNRNRREIEALIRKLDLAGRVLLLDSIDDAFQFFSGLDVFVSAARSEAFGLAIVEAMASGVTVVATMTPGAQEIIEHAKTGRLVPIGDVAEMARAVSELLPDRGQREFLAGNARREVAERFSLDRMASETESLYREISES